MEEVLVRCVLFIVMALTMPLPYYMVVFIGLASYSVVLLMFIDGLLEPLPLWTVIHAIYLIVYGVLLYWLSKALYALVRRLGRFPRMLCLCGAVVGLVVLGLMPVFGIGHEAIAPMDAFSFLYEMMRQ